MVESGNDDDLSFRKHSIKADLILIRTATYPLYSGQRPDFHL